MHSNERIQKMCIAALLCALGILVPMISPVRIQLGPMSFTLASHVALFLAMFISPPVAAAVELGTTLGFLLAGFAPVVVLRAASQIVFVLLGAYWVAKQPQVMRSPVRMGAYGLILGIVHGALEAVVVTLFWFGGATMDGSFVSTVLGLVGVGTVVHSMVDYGIALLIWQPVSRVVRVPVSYRAVRETVSSHS